MACVVTAACFGCKHTHCVSVCPVDCFREGEQMLYIDPECCTECLACVAECPEQAIFAETDVPQHLAGFVALNAEMSRRTPLINRRKDYF